MGKARKVAIDDDDDLPSRVGRPRAAVEFGPPRAEPHEREAYATRLQSILDALDIAELGRDERMYLQRILHRADRLRQFDPKRFNARGDERVILLLRSIAETTNGTAALTLPVIRAVDLCLHEAWTIRGLELLEAMDRVPLLEIRAALKGFGLQDHLDKAIEQKLTDILGPPIAPQPQTKPKKPARKTMVMPQDVSQSAWEDALALYKARRRRQWRSKSPTIRKVPSNSTQKACISA